MSWTGQLAKLRGWRGRGRRERELEEEIRSHIEMEAEENRAAGLSPDEAEYAARRAFGNRTLAAENSREAWQFTVIENFLRDLRYGWRMLARSPGFTAVAVFTLSLGIAATSTIFSVYYEILLRQPSVAEPQQVMVVFETTPDSPMRYRASPLDFLDWQQRNHSFAALAAAESLEDADLARNGEPVRITGMAVTANFFQVLGVQPALGRTFLAGADRPGHGGEILLSYGLWQAQFQSDAEILGKRVRVNAEDYTVVGVMPARFNLWGFPAQVWIPRVFETADLNPQARAARSLLVFGRLRPGGSVASAAAEMKTIAAAIGREFPTSNRHWNAEVLSLYDYRRKEINASAGLGVLMAATGLVMLIACANVAGLLLARAGARRREIAVRVALGAGRRRLLRQLLTEGLLLAALAAGLGLLLAYWGIRWLEPTLHWSEQIGDLSLHLNQAVVGFALGMAAASVLAFALAPAVQAAKADVQETLKEASGRGGTGAGRGRLRRLLVGGEIALSLFLLTGSCLLVGELIAEYSANFGFNPEGLETVGVTLPEKAFPTREQKAAFYEKVINRISKLPGVSTAAVSNALPLTGTGYVRFTRQNEQGLAAEKHPHARDYMVSPGYFSTAQIAILRGRLFTEADRTNTRAVALVNQKFVEKYFAGQDPVGQYLSVDNEAGEAPSRCEIVGVVADVKDWLGQRNDDPQLYRPLLQVPMSSATVAVRTSGNPAAAKDFGRSIWSLGSDRPIVGRVMSMSALIDAMGGAGDKLLTGLMGVFAALAVILAAIGIYGVIAYTVMQRRREIGIRMALGARRRDVMRLVLRDSALVGGVGLAVGTAFALPLPEMFAAIFHGFGESAALPVLIAAPILVALVVLAASLIPCIRALGVNPAGALRCE